MSRSRITTTKRIKYRRPDRVVKVYSERYSGTLWDYLMRIDRIPAPRAKLLQSSGRSGDKLKSWD